MQLKKIVFCFFLSLSTLSFAQNKQVPRYPKWQTVIPGSLLYSPEYTSYGVIALLEGRQLIAITENGVTYWEQNLKRRPDDFLVVSPDDFIYTVTNKNILTVFNPSGMLLWEKQHSQKITKEPLLGLDNRIFVSGETSLAAYDIHGKRKWELSLEENNDLPLLTLNDGSLLYFCKREADGNSVGLRISPFGEVLEEIIFAGKVTLCKEIQNGLLLVFQSGDLGCFTVANNESKSLWVLKHSVVSEIAAVCCKNNLAYSFYQNGALVIFDLYSQQIKVSKIFSEFAVNPIEVFLAKHGVVVLTNEHLFGLDTQGKIIYTYDIKNDGRENKFYYSPKGNLLQFSSDWTLSAYSISQGVFAEEILQINFNRKKTYDTDSNARQFAGNEKDFSVYIKNGDYGVHEKNAYDYVSKILDEIQHYNYTKRQQLAYVSSVRDYQSINYAYELLGNLGTTFFNDSISEIIRTEDDYMVLSGALQCIKKIGYDVTGDLLASLEARLPSLKKNDVPLYFALCDGVVAICRCMGKPVIFTKGKEILTQLMYPQYSSKVRNYAVQSLKKIADFEK